MKSLDEGKHLDVLRETFHTLRWYNMKLNPSKCAFGIASGKFLGFMVSHRGIEANLEKIKAILDMKSRRTLKKSNLSPDELLPLTGLSPKLLTSVCHFSGF